MARKSNKARTSHNNGSVQPRGWGICPHYLSSNKNVTEGHLKISLAPTESLQNALWKGFYIIINSTLNLKPRDANAFLRPGLFLSSKLTMSLLNQKTT